MRSPGGRKVFRDFLRCEYSEENILFWLACEELKKETNPEAIEEKARFIYEDYISILSPKEVSKLLHYHKLGRHLILLFLYFFFPLKKITCTGIIRFSCKRNSE